jgi:hypothetical protein
MGRFSATGPGAIKSAPDPPRKSRADGAKTGKSARYVPKNCEIKNLDKAERSQVADFDRPTVREIPHGSLSRWVTT